MLEFIGEWNDCLFNDIMLLKREVIDPLTAAGVSKFVLIGENVLNFHHSDDAYYEEWFDEVLWRTFTPEQLCRRIGDCVENRWGLLC